MPHSQRPVRGLFVTGTDTGVGKTYVAALIAQALRAAGHRVGVYKPAASGCRQEGDGLVSDDALQLWQAAGSPGELQRVCPQRFAAPLAPHRAACEAGQAIDAALLRDGLRYWQQQSDVIVVEGVGGLMCPLSDDEYVADLAAEFAFPLIVVTRNALGTINHTLQTLITAAVYAEGLDVAGWVLNHATADEADPSRSSNREELVRRCVPPLLAEVGWQAAGFDRAVDWYAYAGGPRGG